ncbi:MULTISPECIES: multiple monosaccharide ABC transporter substrate-binding protein [Streptomyces]|jgi:ABC-type xylose transport system, periplasmic component|uniref:Multiple sugar-binding periplasmic receptor ChvE n=1 Tax=Streptomyces fradiae ATCC 10745 = DSM 40063 TaxID=1319510 RepID=A0A1Y2NWP3_STRFR|nr:MULTISPECIES: multiple monosaccharide ABC transporter substrate-binding protein [Streptomyces]KAF0651594.1 sugar ABC transporter substrate-binding protein [Streptomyces fradiae ATCC 10745 = DSM 40063]OSY51936.1 Multiple sugar-binding periplasmic receptor ChvE precursor [Streptomyces fradiae ATCC 10745 = DSM 40063]QEV11039.1 sugar ABC transporter substrate-binding protein [Streptomyces fradiae ATCC 10745 = DSM 40063]
MKKFRSLSALLAVTTGCALLLSACGRSAEGGSESKDEKDPTVGIAMPTKSSERWIADGRNMTASLEKAGFSTILSYGEDDPDQQVAQIENMITQGVDALVVAAINGEALSNVLRQAADARIPVISYDRLILGSPHVDYYASFDNEKVGELQAAYIVEKLGLRTGAKKGPFNIELFAGSNDDNNTRYFFDGAMKVLKPYLDSGRLVVRSGQTRLNQVTTLRWDGGTAQKRMDDLLTSAYATARVDAVLSPYDGISIGILSALRSDDYGSAAKPLPIVTGQDAEVASVKSIIAGRQTQTVYKDTRALARVAAGMVSAVLAGERPETNDDTTYHNGEKVVPALLLDPVSVDKSNYRKVLVDSGYIDAEALR